MNIKQTLSLKLLSILLITLSVACGEINSDAEELQLEEQKNELAFATRPGGGSTETEAPSIELTKSEMNCVSKAYRIAYSCSQRSRQDGCVASAQRHIERCTDYVYSLTRDDLRSCHADGVDRQEMCLDEGSKNKQCRSEGTSVFNECVESVLFELE